MDARVIGSKAALTAEVGKTPAAISFSTSALDKTVKALTVDGVSLTDENVESGAYKATMPLLYVYSGEPTPATKAFLDFVASDEGKRLAKGK
jgi:phosphate transport system substrate-binding protein